MCRFLLKNHGLQYFFDFPFTDFQKGCQKNKVFYNLSYQKMSIPKFSHFKNKTKKSIIIHMILTLKIGFEKIFDNYLKVRESKIN